MKTQEAPNLLDNAKQKIKRLEDSLEQAEAERDELFRKWSASSSNREKDREEETQRLREALEKINELSYRDDVCVGQIAEQALKEK